MAYLGFCMLHMVQWGLWNLKYGRVQGGISTSGFISGMFNPLLTLNILLEKSKMCSVLSLGNEPIIKQSRDSEKWWWKYWKLFCLLTAVILIQVLC